jgi:hypothetical protein
MITRLQEAITSYSSKAGYGMANSTTSAVA